MNIRWTAILLASAALAGCGGSDEKEPPEQSGVLQAGKVSGVSYSTATRSGTTDTSGTFKYLPGETVSFSIGAIQLGSARGSTAITPFTLAGLTPPTTEFSLRSELDRAIRQATPFTRAVNIQFLLMSLDADHNPANGLDVGAQAGALANASLDLGLPISTFANKVQYLGPNVTRGIPLTRAVVQLYRAMNINVIAHVASRETTTDASGLYSSSRFVTYGADGSRTSLGDDFGNDGSPESQYTYGYDAVGRISNVAGVQRSIFLSQAYRNSYEYNALGILTGGNEDYDFGADGVTDVRFRHNISVDSLGRRTGDVVDQDDGLDGVIDGRLVHTYGWDAHNNNTSYSGDYDHGFDGVVDEKVRYTMGYDARDRSTGNVYEVDSDADGKPNWRDKNTFELGSGAFPVRAVAETDYDADGVADYRTITVSTYDAEDNELTRTIDEDYDVDGTTDYRQFAVFTYNRERRRLTYEVDQDYDADGTMDLRQRQVTNYDTAGNPLTSRVEYINIEGVVEFQTITECHYGAGGEKLDCANSSLGGGAIDPQADSTVSVQNEIFADGVLALAQLYLGN